MWTQAKTAVNSLGGVKRRQLAPRRAFTGAEWPEQFIFTRGDFYPSRVGYFYFSLALNETALNEGTWKFLARSSACLYVVLKNLIGFAPVTTWNLLCFACFILPD